MAKQAEAARDPEGLVFAAVRLSDGEESVRLVDEAVRLDPNLLWAYALVARHRPGIPEADQWLRRLESSDPQNALFRLIAAQRITDRHLSRRIGLPPGERQAVPQPENNPAWREAMAAAFAAPKFDDYLDRLRKLDRDVIRRYAFNHPIEVLMGDSMNAPIYAFSEGQRYAKWLLQSGRNLAAQGNDRGAREECWTVARFGQMLDSQGRSDYERWTGTALQAMAYKQLQAMSQRDNNTSEAVLFGYLGQKFDPVRGDYARTLRGRVFGKEISSRNAAVLQISSLAMLVSFGLTLVAAAVLVAGGWRRKSPKPLATAMALTGATVLLLSSATLYLTYRPYWYLFQNMILSDEPVHSRDLGDFLRGTLEASAFGRDVYYPMYFWAGVTLLGVAGLAIVLLRAFRHHPPHAGTVQHSSPVP